MPAQPLSFEELLAGFENAWKEGRQPILTDYVLPADHPRRQELIQKLCALDLDYRFQNWHTPPFVHHYVPNEGISLPDSDLAALIGLEYQRRWQLGGRVARKEYTDKFPHLALALNRLLIPRSSCPTPGCKTQIELPDEAATEALCPNCQKSYSVSQLFNIACDLPPDHADANLVSPMLHQDLGRGGFIHEIAADPRLGSEIDGYRLLQKLGQGGMGVVYRARDRGLGRDVALKMISGQGLAKPDLVRFSTEMEALSRLAHPHIVQIFKCGTVGELPYFVMEYLEQGSLAARISGKAQRPLDAARLVMILAKAIHAAHQSHIFHRDLKPGNILLARSSADVPELNTPWGWPKVADFGLAKLADQGASLSVGGVPLGTPPYMAPEQVRGEPGELGPETDVYGLGAILYELLVGRPPFQGAGLQEIWDQVINHAPAAPRSIHPHIPVKLEQICLKCLAKKPGERYASAEALVEDLMSFQSEPAETGSPTNRSAVLVCSELVDSFGLNARLGNLAYGDLVRQLDSLFREVVHALPGSRILQETGACYLAEFPSITGAVTGALMYQHAVRTSQVRQDGVAVRVAVHQGDVADLRSAGGATKVVGMAADLVGLISRLALPGQVLLTTPVAHEARNNIHGHPPTEDAHPPRLEWKDHGPYLFLGQSESVAISEVGAVGSAPLREPPDTTLCRRNLAETEKITYGEKDGWRPACGIFVPRRENWLLKSRLGEGGSGEVWLAEQTKTHKKRVFKFCFKADRLAGLRLESAMFRLLKQTLGEREDIAQIIDWQFEAAPYFLESEYTEGGSLRDWIDAEGGFERVELAGRLEMVAQAAMALDAAHKRGVIHRDIKPSNILVKKDAAGKAHAVVADFGISRLTDPGLFRKYDITTEGMTQALGESSGSGTRMYMAPEVHEGAPPTTQSDIFSLGVVLYQIVAADWHKPLRGTGWERDVADEILREIIAACVDQDVSHRLHEGAELAKRLRGIEETRAERRAERERWRRRERERLRRRQLLIAGSSVVLIALLSTGAYWWSREARLRHVAEESQQKAEKLLKDLQASNGQLELEKQQTESLRKENAEIAAKFMVEKGLSLATGDRPELFKSLSWFAEAKKRDNPEPVRSQNHRMRIALSLAQCPRLTHVCPQGEKVTYALFHPSGETIISAAGKTVKCWSIGSDRLLWELPHTGVIEQLELNADGTRLFTRTATNIVQVWDLTKSTIGESPFRLTNVAYAAIDRFGKLVVAVTNELTAEVWDSAAGRKVATLVHEGGSQATQNPPPDITPKLQSNAEVKQLFACVAISPDGTRIIAGGARGLHLWDTRTGKAILELLGPLVPIRQVSILGDDKVQGVLRVVAVPRLVRNKFAFVWNNVDDPAGMSECLIGADEINAAGFSPDGRWITTTEDRRKTRIWTYEGSIGTRASRAPILAQADLQLTAELPRTEHENDPILKQLGIGIRSKRTRTAETSSKGKNSDVAYRDKSTLTLDSGGIVNGIAFSPDGQFVATAGSDGTVDLNPITSSRAGSFLPHMGAARSVVFSRNGRSLLTASDDGHVRIWDLQPAWEAEQSPQHLRLIREALLSGDGSRVLILDKDEQISVSSVKSSMPFFAPVSAGGHVQGAWLSSDGKRLGTLDDGMKLQFRDGDSGAPLGSVQLGAHRDLPQVLFHPDGRSVWVTTGSLPGENVLSLLSLNTGKEVWNSGNEGSVLSITMSQDGQRIFAVVEKGFDVSGRLWSVNFNEAYVPEVKLVSTLAFLSDTLAKGSRQPPVLSPDGQRLLTAAARELRIWDLSSPEPSSLRLETGGGSQWAQFSADGRIVIAGSEGKKIDFLDAATGALLSPPLVSPADVKQAVICAKGGSLVTRAPDNTLRTWPLGNLDELTEGDLLSRAQLQSGSWIVNGLRTGLPAGELDKSIVRKSGPLALNSSSLLGWDPTWHWRATLDSIAAEQWNSAGWHIERLLENQPSPALFALRGDVYFSAGDFNKAMEYYSQIGQTVRDDPFVNVKQASANLKRGQEILHGVTLGAPLALLDAFNSYDACSNLLDRSPSNEGSNKVRLELAASYATVQKKLRDNWTPIFACQICRVVIPTGMGPTASLPALTSAGQLSSNSPTECLGRAWKLIAKLPKDENSRRTLNGIAADFRESGREYRASEEWKKALVEYKEALKWQTRAEEGLPMESLDWDRHFRAQMDIGNVYRDSNDRKMATVSFLEALDRLDAWKALKPLSSSANQNYTAICSDLAVYSLELKDFAAAEMYYQKALASAKAWVELEPNDPKSVEMLGYVYRDLANISTNKGQTRHAAVLFEEYLAICAKLTSVDRKHEYIMRTMAKTHQTLGRHYDELGELEKSGRHWQASLDVYNSILQISPDDRDCRKPAAEAYEWLVHLSLQLGQIRSARNHSSKCIEIARKLEAAYGLDNEGLVSLFYNYYWTGLVNFKGCANEETKKAYAKCEELRDKLGQSYYQSEDNRDHAQGYFRYLIGSFFLAKGDGRSALEFARPCADYGRIRWHWSEKSLALSRALALLGDSYLELGNVAQARLAFEELQNVAETKLGHDPKNREAQLEIANTWARLGRLETCAGNYDRAQKHFSKSLTILGKKEELSKDKQSISNRDIPYFVLQRGSAALKLAPRGIEDMAYAKSQPREVATELLILRAVVLMRKEEYAGAEATAEELQKLLPEDPVHLFNVARCFGQLFRAVSMGEPVENLPPKVKARRRAYAQKAITALSRAVEGGFRDIVRVIQEPDIDILRLEEGFRQIVEKLDKSPK